MATTAVDRWFLDANILVYATVAAHPLHATAIAQLTALESAGAEFWISRQVVREYLAVMTRPGTYTGTVATAVLVANVQRFERSYQIAPDTAAVTGRLLHLLTAVKLGGKQVHDANIVATMLEYGIPNLLTHNVADFSRFGTLITVTPLVP
jgi:predicted nucleic acid-binding protein